MSPQRQAQQQPSLAPFVIAASVAAAGWGIWMRWPGLVAIWIGVIVAAWMEPPAILTGKKDASGFPTPAHAGEVKQLARYRFWSELRWKLFLPGAAWLPGWPIFGAWAAGLIGAGFAAQLPTANPSWRALNAAAVFLTTAGVAATRRRTAAEGDSPGVRVDTLLSLRDTPPLVAAALVVGVTSGVGSVLAVDAYLHDRSSVNRVLVGINVAVLTALGVLAPSWAKRSLAHWKVVVAGRAEWRPRWDAIKVDPAPFLVDRNEVGTALVDTFEAAPGLPAMTFWTLTPKIAPTLGSGTLINVLSVPDETADGPVPGTRHPLRFQIAAWSDGQLCDFCDSSVAEDVIELGAQCAMVSAMDGIGYARPILAQVERLTTDDSPVAVWRSVWAMPDGPPYDELRKVLGNISDAFGCITLIDHRAGVLYFGAIGDDSAEFADPSAQWPTALERLDTEDEWNTIWSQVLKQDANPPSIQHGTRKTAELADGTEVSQVAWMVRLGIDPDEYRGLEPKLATALESAPFVAITGWPGEGDRPGERHPQAFVVYWSKTPVPSSPERLAPSAASRWVLAGRVNQAFDAARLARPEIVNPKVLTKPSATRHIWEIPLRLYKGVTLADVRGKLSRLRESLGVSWLRVAAASDGCVLFVGAAPDTAELRVAKDRLRLTALDWSQAWINSGVTGVNGQVPELVGVDHLPRNEQVEVLDFSMPPGVDPVKVKGAIDKLKNATGNEFIEVRPGSEPSTTRLLVSAANPLPSMVAVDFDAVDSSDGIPFATGVEGEPITFSFLDSPHALIAGLTGSGKSQPLTALVPVPLSKRFPGGWARVGDLKIGDLVFTGDGSAVPIISFSDTSIQDVAVVCFDDGQRIECSHDHLWRVVRHTRPSREEREAAERRSRIDAGLVRSVADKHPSGVVATLGTLSGLLGIPKQDLAIVLPESLAVRVPEPDEDQSTTTLSVVGTDQPSTVITYPVDEVCALLLSELARPTHHQSPVISRPTVLSVESMRHAGVIDDNGMPVFEVDLPGYVQLPAQDLPLDPWLLGAWIDGHGVTSDAVVSQRHYRRHTVPDRSEQAHLVHKITELGWMTKPGVLNPGIIVVDGLADTAAEDVGIGPDRLLPPIYLRSSVTQRLALLQGLMDTGGMVANDGSCTLEIGNGPLAAQILGLIRSLGVKASMSAALGVWIITFLTDAAVFTLDSMVQRLPSRVPDDLLRLSITSIELTNRSVPMRCLVVDHPDHVYLTGSFVPTHNSVLAQVVLYGALVRGWRCYVIDPVKGGADFAFAKDRCVAFAGTPFEASGVMKTIYAEVVRRKDLNAKHGVGSYLDLPDDIRPPHIGVLIDEFTSLLGQAPLPPKSDDLTMSTERDLIEAENFARTEVGVFAGKLAREARSAGVTLLLGTQKLNAKMLDSIPGASDLKPLTMCTNLPVPVSSKFPTGWAQNRELDVGDELFTPSGRITRIVGFSEVPDGQPVYRVTFADGQSVECGGGHWWEVFDAQTRAAIACGTLGPPSASIVIAERAEAAASDPASQCVASPEDIGAVIGISADLVVSEAQRFGVLLPKPSRHFVAHPPRIPAAAFFRSVAADYRNKETANPVAPRLLTTAEILATQRCEDGSPNWAVRVPRSLHGDDTKLLMDPYILGTLVGRGRARLGPAVLRRSDRQRLAALQGIMDTAGIVDVTGTCEITVLDAVAGRDIMITELVRSLGFLTSPTPNTHRDIVRFIADRQVFRVPYLSQRFEKFLDLLPRGQAAWNPIVSIEESSPRPMRCIGVDDPGHLFLVEGFIPTHNTNLARTLLGKASFGDRASALRAPDDAPKLEGEVGKGRGLWEPVTAAAQIIQGWFSPQEDFRSSLIQRVPELPATERLDLSGFAGPATHEGAGDDVEQIVDIGTFTFDLDDLDVDEDEDNGPAPIDDAQPEIDGHGQTVMEHGSDIAVPDGPDEVLAPVPTTGLFDQRGDAEPVVLDGVDSEPDDVPSLATSPVVLFCDVDGVIAPIAKESGDTGGWNDWELVEAGGVHLFVSRSMADAVAGVPAQRVWLTSWKADADTFVGPAIGWSSLPVAADQGVDAGDGDTDDAAWWKLHAARGWLSDHPGITHVVWCDDDLAGVDDANRSNRDMAFETLITAGIEPDRILLIAPNRDIGLTREDVARINAFLPVGDRVDIAPGPMSQTSNGTTPEPPPIEVSVPAPPNWGPPVGTGEGDNYEDF